MQSLTVSRERPPYILPASVAITNQFFLVTCLGLVLLNFLTFAYHLTGSTLFNALSNAVSLLLISCSVYVALVGREEAGFYKIFLVLACVFVGASYLANYGSFEIADALKFLSLYTFYIAGRSAPGHWRPAEKWCIYALAALPLIFKLAGDTKVYVGAEFPDVFAYFPNTNTAALYFAALCFSLSHWFGNKMLVVQFINAAVMNRVGAALATILAIVMWSFFPLRPQVLVAFFIGGIAGCIAYAFGAMDRLLTGLDSMALIWSLNPGTVARMTYKQLIDLTGTTDLSAFFRIIHWTNIFEYYSTQGLGVILFGYGAGQSGIIAVMPMPPHNDYLRVLAEYGLLNFLVFAFFVVSILLSLKLQAAKILFTVLLIYFFSENLLDNFTSMALFFSFAGRLTSQQSSGSSHA
ncbi:MULTISPECIES: O-antigen ligase family protein [unclassified Bradyrhizobium]|uniref:O-antigen ligase family protein n=1 Tax=unclassified Bradyrhizobium TaxID=2631580 RepID=UPI002FF3C24C